MGPNVWLWIGLCVKWTGRKSLKPVRLNGSIVDPIHRPLLGGGGWWERLIRLLKRLLKKTLGRASLTCEELETVLCDCEAVINSRTLTYIPEDTADLAPLTPNILLKDLRGIGLPDCDTVDSARLTRRAKYGQEIKERLRD